MKITRAKAHTAKAMLRLSRAAYGNQREVEFVSSRMNNIRPFEAEGDKGFVCSNELSSFVSFSGTDSILDWLTYCSWGKTWCLGAHREVYSGFAAAFFPLIGVIADRLRGLPKTVFVTGHSRGGALATLCAAWLHYKGYDVTLVTFGCPKVIASDDEEYTWPVKTLRFTNSCDPVPYWPLWGFCHVGDRFHFGWRNPIGPLLALRADWISRLFDPFWSHSLDSYEKRLDECLNK